jgi:hypothetical protein
MSFHPEILSTRQQGILKRLGPQLRGTGFYLGGGTAIATHLGHRRSVDLDWFCQEAFERPLRLADKLTRAGIPLIATHNEPGTLLGKISGVQISFMHYGYRFLKRPQVWADFGCQLASLDDLAAMKLEAVAQRGAKKDFVDIYAILSGTNSLAELLDKYCKKYVVEDTVHLLYSLTYFEDAKPDPMPKMLWHMNWREIQKELRKQVASLIG